MKYFICGFSGAGKTSLLKKIKASNQFESYEFADLDESVLRLAGLELAGLELAGLELAEENKSLGELIEVKGWDWFRRIERETLEQLLLKPNIWIALGGGSLDEALAQELMKREDVKGYWLDTDFDICWSRIQNDSNRPLVKQGRKLLSHLYEERLKVFKRFDRIKA